MNTELYFPRSGKSFSRTSERSFEETVKQLGEADINIFYKTEINLTKSGVAEALKESTGGSEKIDLIFIADAFKKDDPEEIAHLLEELGLKGKASRSEAVIKSGKADDDHMPVPALMIEADNNPAKQEAEEKPEPDKSFGFYILEYEKRLLVFLPTQELVGADFEVILKNASTNLEKPKKKTALWKRFIPCSGDSPFDVVRKIILLLAICTFIVSSCMLVNILLVEPAENDATTNSIRDMLVSTDESSETVTKKPIDGSQGSLIDFSRLIAENPDTIGWIKVPNTIIDHVVVKPPEGADPEYYLYRDFYGNYSKYGTVFMDYRSELDSKNIIIHGHHMQDGRMFANLKHYEDLEFYKTAPTFTFNNIYEKNEWKIISIFKTNTLDYQGDFFNYLRGNFESDYDFLNYIYQIRERSIIDCPVGINENDSIVTLSTCAYDFQDFRFVIVARKVRDGEDKSVDVSKAVENPDPLYPDIWYNYYGGTKPTLTSFQDAFNNNKITWYDGKRTDWSEEDDANLNKTLDDGKKKAIDLLTDYINKRKYSADDEKSIKNLLDQYIVLINKAASGQEINELYDNAVKDFQTYKTVSEQEESQKKQESTDLANAKSVAKTEVHNSVAGNSYRRTQLQEVNKLFEDYNKLIDEAKTIEEVDKLKAEGKAALAKIKTSTELDKEESDQKSKEAEESRLAQESKQAEESSKRAETSRQNELGSARATALVRISGSYRLSNYKPAQQSEIREIVEDYTERINDSDSVSDISSYADQAISDISKIMTAAEIDAQQSSEQLSEQSSEESPVEPESSVDESSEPESSEEEESSEQEESSEEEPEVPQGGD